MLCVEGFRLGSRTRLAFDQSTSSALSCASQNLRSCASDLNRGTLVFAFIGLSLFAVHVARRDNPDARSLAPKRERHMEVASIEGRTQGVIARLVGRVTLVRHHKQSQV